MPNHWLLKTEPTAYSYTDLERTGHATWDGVANPLAVKHLRALQRGDGVFIYHTGSEKQIVGVAEVTRSAYLNADAEWVVDLKPRQRLKTPVTLAAIKARPEFADFELVRLPRLSVMPVSAARWKALLAAAA